MRSWVLSRAVSLIVACVLVSSCGQALGDGDQRVIALTLARTVAAGTTASSANPLWDVPLAALSATRDRPLFSASRRPPPPIVAPVTVMRAPPPMPKEPERPALQLVGTVIGDDESFGIFVDSGSQKSLRLRVGALHEGWLLDAVKPREVTLRRELDVMTLPMPPLGPFAEGAARPSHAATRTGDRSVRRRAER
ncbi:hypothetical protein [Bradyrhizobium sp. USDA 4353]